MMNAVKLQGKIKKLEAENQRLKQENDKLKTGMELLDRVNDIVYRFELSPEKRFTYVSPSATGITGYSPEDHYNDPELGLTMIHPDDRHLLEEATFNADRPSEKLILRWLRKNGETIWTEHSIKYYTDGKGKLVALEGIARDITERESAIEKLKQSQELFSKAFHSGPVLMSISTIQDGTYLEVNDVYLKTTGFAAGEVIGKTSVEIGFISDKDRKKLAGILQHEGRVGGLELELTKKSGAKFWCSYFGEIIIVDGRQRLLSIAVDITEQKKHQENVIQNEQRLREAERIGRIGHVDWDVENRMAYWSDEMYRIYEWEERQPLPDFETLLKMHPPQDASRIEQAVRKGIDHGIPYEIDVEVVTRKGNQKFVHLIGKPVMNEAGKVTNLKGTVQDVTEQKRSQQKLIESEKKFRSYIDFAPDGILIVDEEGRYLEVNNAACKITGYTAQELLDMKISDTAAKEDLSKADAHFKTLKDKGFASDEIGFITKNGEKRYWDVAAVILSDSRFLGFVKDVTEKKLANERIKESEARFREIFNSTSEAIIIHDDKEGALIDCNDVALQMYGYDSKQEMMNCSIKDFSAGGEEYGPKIIRNNIQKALEEGSATFEWLARKKDGSEFWVEVSLRSSKIAGEGMVLAVVRDISDRKQAETALMEQTRLLNKMGEIARIGGWELDLRTHKVKWTEEAYKIHEVDQNYEPEFNRVLKFYQNDVQERLKHAVDECVRTGKPYELEMPTLTARGKQLWVHVVGNPIFEKGELVKIYGSIQDITQRKKTEQELRESEEKFRTLVEQDADGLLLHDLQGNILDVNQTSVEQYAYSREELLKMNIRDIDPDYDEREDKGAFYEAMEYNKPVRFEARQRRKSGGIFPVEVTLTKIRLHAQTYIMGLCRDITEKKHAEISLRESEAKFRTVFDQSPIGIEIYRADGIQIDANRASLQMFGISGKEEILSFNMFAGTSLNSHLKDSLRRGETVSYQAAFDFDQVKELGQYHTKKSGKAVFDYIITPMMNDEGKLTGYLAMVQDVTERKRIERELILAKDRAEESDRLKSAFLANMSHEIRTPMNGILGFADLLKDPELSGEKQMKYISVIEKSGERMLNTINNLIDISKIEAGQMTLNISPVCINEQIDEVEAFFREEAVKKGLVLECSKFLPDAESVVETDGEKLYAILANLVKNAIKYTPAGKVNCGYRLHHDTFEFFVQDTGIGIPGPRQEVIFDRFVQADVNIAGPFEGSGLGLAIAKAYVEMLGGEIRLESNEGKGTNFFFTLPDNRVERNQENEQIIPEKRPSDREIPPLRVMIVEDNEQSAVYLDNVLKSGFHEILHAKTGTEAVEIMRDNPDIRLVLMDIKMPGMDGYEATREIRQFNKGAIIIAQTAFALAGDREKAIEAGCNDYITKPLKKDRLLTMISKYFSPQVHGKS